jgi:hypothetical protein
LDATADGIHVVILGVDVAFALHGLYAASQAAADPAPRVKPEPVSLPLNQGGGIVIRERRGPLPPRGRLVRVKREPAEEGGHTGGHLRKLKKEHAHASDLC